MDVSVQRGGPAFVLDGYQWYSNTAPLCSRESGKEKKRTRRVWGRRKTRKQRNNRGKEKEENRSTALPNKKHASNDGGCRSVFRLEGQVFL